MPQHLFILGAGFSANAGLPVAAGFTEALLDVSALRSKTPSAQIIRYLRKFADDTFGNGSELSADHWPPLEDIFTLVDLAANTGHNLGPGYSAAQLRTVRRGLIVRLIRMLQTKYVTGKRKAGDDWKALEKFLSRLNLSDTAILNLNWDSVVERGLALTQSKTNFNYGCDAWPVEEFGDRLEISWPRGSRYQLLKPHGSVNWLYCDVCRQLFWFQPAQIENVAKTLFGIRDWTEVQGRLPATDQIWNPNCPRCENAALGTRLATFSYRKALEFPMHAETWRRAEYLLQRADTWIFFGYSMPPADFEFKHLLKRVELSRRDSPHIVLITDNDQTRNTYERFFGPDRSGNRSYFTDKLSPEVFDHLRTLGALRARASPKRSNA